MFVFLLVHWFANKWMYRIPSHNWIPMLPIRKRRADKGEVRLFHCRILLLDEESGPVWLLGMQESIKSWMTDDSSFIMSAAVSEAQDLLSCTADLWRLFLAKSNPGALLRLVKIAISWAINSYELKRLARALLAIIRTPLLARMANTVACGPCLEECVVQFLGDL